jgi:non-specific serine/threonine protein kinase/serine/threonine-protein kinase
MDKKESSEKTITFASTGGTAQTIGPYHLLQKIGEGGMGEVWIAEQHTPIRRSVAVKVIKVGMDTQQVVARFEAERQALAVMDHPAIAKVLDAGSTTQGRPYFVMEYVKGEPITAYCDRHRLSTADRLSLFIRVCEGVQHAHQKGIIHRDLKPSNVFVALQDGQPVPKIIDFGIAKATALHLTEQTLFTELGVLIGTPEYMSPEQAEMTGLDIDTRTDVYALGVLLYELLTGTVPFDRKMLREKGLDEIRRAIREIDPPRPSTRITQLGPASTEAAKNRLSEPSRLASLLRGDLDWITMKALEKDRTRRYGSTSDLAEDIRRHMDSQPVLASPPSTTYRIKKFVRRHRLGVASAVSIAVLLVAFAVTMAVLAQRIARERDLANQESVRASREAEAAKQVSDFLVSVFRVSDPSEARGNTVTAREVLDRGAAKLESELAGQPQVQARLMTAVAVTYDNLGLWKQARPLYERAYQIRRNTLGPNHPDTLGALSNLSGMFLTEQNYAEAERYGREALDGYRRVLGIDHPRTFTEMQNFAGVLQMSNKLSEAETLYREALNAHRRKLGSAHPNTVIILGNLGQVLYHEGKYSDAEQYLKEALDRRQADLGGDHPDTLWTLHAIGRLRLKQKRFAEAESYFRQALEGRRRVLPPGHFRIGLTATSLGWALNEQARYREAEPVLREAVAILAMASPDDLDSAEAETQLGRALVGQRRFVEAEPLLLRSYGRLVTSPAADEDDKQLALAAVIDLYDAWSKPDKAAEWQKKLPQAK